MIRRILALGMMLALMLTTAAFAEAVAPEAFVMQETISWSSTPDEVAAVFPNAEKAEKEDPDIGTQISFSGQGDMLWGYTADQSALVFYNDQLCIVGAYYTIEDEADVEKLIANMAQEFGEPNMISQENNGVEKITGSAAQTRMYCDWELADGTKINVSRMPQTVGGQIRVTIQNAPFLQALAEKYNQSQEQ